MKCISCIVKLWKKIHHNRRHYHYINWKKTLGLKLNSLLRTMRTTLTFKLLSLLELLMKSSVYVKIRDSRVRVVTFCTPMETNTILSTPCVLNSIRNTMLLHVWISNYLGSLQNMYIEDRRMSINWIIVFCIWNSDIITINTIIPYITCKSKCYVQVIMDYIC